jgi:hypothetical protein
MYSDLSITVTTTLGGGSSSNTAATQITAADS